MLEGKKVKCRTKADVVKLLDQDIVYLTERDIDQTGRGFFIPRFGQVRDYWKRQVNISGDWVSLSRIREMVLNEGQYEKQN